jgi:metallo-beta-lactamase family protein
MINEAEITFLGGAGTVTGSKFLVTYQDTRILIDCGMFQGLKELRVLNWEDLPVVVDKIDMVLLTHGHLDHVGYLPRLHQQGFKGPIYATGPTLSIAKIILEDSGKIQEEEAEKANTEGYSKHAHALPFYTVEQAKKTIELFREVQQDEWQITNEHIKYRFVYNGHILGSTFIELQINEKIFVFSGDLGREHDPLLFNPKKPRWADYLFIESTYGDRLHPKDDFDTVLGPLIDKTIEEKGVLVVPSFAVERLQLLMYLFWKGHQQNKHSPIPIYVDSPMGNRVLDVFQRFIPWHKLSDQEFHAMIDYVNVVTSYQQTWEVIDKKGPKIIIAGSGMVTGGRVLTYLQQFIDRPNTRILLVGFQAEGTRGRQLKEGVKEVKIYGKYFPVSAEVHSIESLSAHGDQAELLSWMSEIKNVPEGVYLIHGEPQVQEIFARKISQKYGWHVSIPKLNEVIKFMV